MLLMLFWVPATSLLMNSAHEDQPGPSFANYDDALKPPVTAARTPGSMGQEDEAQEVTCVCGGFRVRSRVPYERRCAEEGGG